MRTTSSALTAKMRTLRTAFIVQVPSQLSETRDLLREIKTGEVPEQISTQIKRTFHNLKGSAATFGLVDLSVAAETAETFVDQVIGQSHCYLDDFVDEVTQHISTIEWLSTHTPRDLDLDPTDGVEQTVLDALETHSESDVLKTVYLCDDDPFQVEQIQTQLSCFGYDVHTFSNLDDMHNAITAKIPDAVIMDVVFPEGEDAGTTFIQNLQPKNGPVLPTVFISGRSDFQTRLQAVKAGGAAFLTKPLRCLDIVEHLDILTSRAQPDPYRVLVVDDEPQIAEFHASVLKDAGMAVQVIHEPASTVESLREFRPELVLVDMYMPGCNGHELAQVIRQMPEYISMPIVYLSSETNTEKQQLALAAGADGFLTKPIDPGELVSAVVVRAERMRALRSLMVRDSLTGLFNHTATKQFLENAVVNARRYNGTLCYAVIDVDHFKAVNDTYGHPVGDRVLLALSRMLRQKLRQNDVIGRLGGEEFGVVLLEAGLAKAKEIIDALRVDFTRVKFWAKDVEFSVSFSAGLAEFPDCDGVEALSEQADKALYAAKFGGRNKVLVADKGRVET